MVKTAFLRFCPDLLTERGFLSDPSYPTAFETVTYFNI